MPEKIDSVTYYTAVEIAKAAGVSKSWISKLLANGTIWSTRRIKGIHFVEELEVTRWMKSRKGRGRPRK